MTTTTQRRPSALMKGLGVALLLSVSACASGAGPGASFSERDPYESTNRSIHSFNVALDRNVLRPVAQGYDTVTPGIVRFLLGNAFTQLDTFNDFGNFLLQGDIDRASRSFGRLAINTILGAGGLLDPATDFGLSKDDTDFGVTLATYGVGEGAFLMLPFFGPSTTRDLGGRVGDLALSPTTYIGLGVEGTIVDIALPTSTAVEVVDERAQNADLIDDLLYNSEDSYVSLRSIYLQRRDALIAEARGEADALPDIFDEDASGN